MDIHITDHQEDILQEDILQEVTHQADSLAVLILLGVCQVATHQAVSPEVILLAVSQDLQIASLQEAVQTLEAQDSDHQVAVPTLAAQDLVQEDQLEVC